MAGERSLQVLHWRKYIVLSRFGRKYNPIEFMTLCLAHFVSEKIHICNTPPLFSQWSEVGEADITVGIMSNLRKSMK